MLASSSILSRFANRLFQRSRRRLKRADLRRRTYTPTWCAAEVLEERALLSATFDGALSLGNATGMTTAFGVAADAAGNSYITGSFQGTVDFDPGAGVHELTARGSSDIYVAKYAADNSLVWVQRMGGDALFDGTMDPDRGQDIKLDSAGNVYVSGDFVGTGDFGASTLTSAGNSDAFVVKLNAGGAVQWARSWGTSVSEYGTSVGVDAAGNVYLNAYDPIYGSMTTTMLKINPTGSKVLWTKSIETQQSLTRPDMAVDASGNVFVAGNFDGSADFDPGSRKKIITDTGVFSSYVLKLDTKGSFVWVSPFLGWDVHARSVAVDGSGNVIVGGGYDGTVDFDPGSGTSTLPSTGGGFIAKLNGSGALLWAKAFESSTADALGAFVNRLDVDAAGSIYAAGHFSGTGNLPGQQGVIDLDPGIGVDAHTSNGSWDVFVVKLTAAGDFSWSATFGGTGAEGLSEHGANRAIAIAVDPTGGVHLVGTFMDTVDFDPDPLESYYLTAGGTQRNAFRLRLRQV